MKKRNRKKTYSTSYYERHREDVKKSRMDFYYKNRDRIINDRHKRRETLEGFANCMFLSIKHRIKDTKNNPTYSSIKILFNRLDFLKWCLRNKDYLKLHNEWILSNKEFKLTPSIDRIDNYSDYSFDNIQVLTVSQNSSKSNLIDRRKCRHCGMMN